MSDVASPDDFDRHVRRVAPERWLASRLIANATARTEVLALYALDDELARVAPAVSQPMLGEIRLAWWREALVRAAEGGAAEHPVIAALAPALRAGRLRACELDTLVGAHEVELFHEPFADEDALVAWLDARFGVVMAAAAGLLAGDPTAKAVRHAGRAWGWAALRRAEPAWLSAGAPPWPAAWSDRAPAVVASRIAQALASSQPELKQLATKAFPAVAYATLVRGDAQGRPGSEVSRRMRLVWAAARGRI